MLIYLQTLSLFTGAVLLKGWYYMLLFRFKILIRGCTRTGLYGLNFKKHHIFLILHIAAAPLFSLSVVRSALELQSDASYLYHIFVGSCACAVPR